MKPLPLAAGLLGLVVNALPLRAESFLFDLATTGKVVFPGWMPERPVAAAKAQAELSFPIVPGNADEDLAVTIVFQEEFGGYLSVYWLADDGRKEMLCANLFEGTGLPNQRTLLLTRPMMGGPGKIMLQSSESVLNVARVRLDWVRPGVVRLADAAPNGAVITNSGKFLAPEEVDGTPLTPIADTWQDRILTTSITEQAERIEQGVQFPVTIPNRVERARVEVQVSGLKLEETLQFWLNGELFGSLAMELPDLSDPGYERSATPNGEFSGWRKGVLLIPPGKLHTGDNQFQFQPPQNRATAIRDFLLQVQYATPD
jgi:hypothetical protein